MASGPPDWQIRTLESQIQGVTGAMGRLESKIERLEGKLDHTEEKLDQMQRDLSNYAGMMRGLEHDVTGLIEDRVASVKSLISDRKWALRGLLAAPGLVILWLIWSLISSAMKHGGGP